MSAANTGRCMKCKKQVVIQNGKQVKKGKMMFLAGTCPKCSTKVFRILGRAK